MKVWLLFINLVFIGVTSLAAQNIGKITFADGDIQVLRDGELIDSGRVDVGFALENEDQVRVLKGAEAEISIDSKTGVPAVIKMKGVSVLNLTISNENNKQTADLELVSGSVNLKVQKLLGTNQLNVRTDNAVMGVRGTEFSVDTEVDGDALLVTSEGRVECTTDEGKSLFSTPGSVVQSDTEQWSNQSVEASQSATFRDTWRQARIKRFVDNSGKLVPLMAQRYLELRKRFDAAWDRFQTHKEIIQKWSDETRVRKFGDRLQAARDKRAIGVDLATLRRLSVQLERWNHRLSRILDVLSADDIKKINAKLNNGSTAWEFFQTYSKDRAELERKIARVHFASKLFAQR